MLPFSWSTMTKDEIFSIWAPDATPWSRWTKPVTFAHLDPARVPSALPDMPETVDWAPPRIERVALVLDLPGAESVTLAIALAVHGYRPVPLFNAVPMPVNEISADDTAHANVAAVDMFPILDALQMGAVRLQELNVLIDAPPAFLLDANRHGEERIIHPGEFDNRSISFPSDFPSANFLAAQGIRRALLVQRNRTEPRTDLAHTLRRWQDGGVQLERINLGTSILAEAFEVARPTWYGAMFQRVLSSLGLRHAWGGGFGAWLPDSAGGG
jgi:hypothetical protein